MQIFNINLNNVNSFKLPPLVATIGQFDGLHLGHMSLINKCLDIKKNKNFKSALITFSPRVDVIIKNDSITNYLLDYNSFVNKLVSYNIDYLIIIDFNKEVSNISHKDFITKLLLPLNIKELIVGFDFSYGYLGLGNPSTIYEDSNDLINPIIIEEQTINDIKIGTNQIKHYLSEGNIIQANKLLGYNFFINLNKTKSIITCDNINLLKNKSYSVIINNNNYIIEKVDNQFFIKESLFIDDNITTIEFIK